MSFDTSHLTSLAVGILAARRLSDLNTGAGYVRVLAAAADQGICTVAYRCRMYGRSDCQQHTLQAGYFARPGTVKQPKCITASTCSDMCSTVDICTVAHTINGGVFLTPFWPISLRPSG
jgi:hypothetical protein